MNFDLKSAAPLLIGLVLFFIIGALWMRFFWKVLDPWMRKVLGRILKTNIHLGEQSIWQMNLESEDSLNWRNIFIRPIQMVAWMSAGLIPLFITLVIILKVFGTGS